MAGADSNSLHRIKSHFNAFLNLLNPPCPVAQVGATVEQRQALLFLEQRRGMLFTMQFITLLTLVFDWSALAPKTELLIQLTLLIGQVVSFVCYRKAVNIASEPGFSPKPVRRILYFIVVGIRLSFAIVFSVAIYYESPLVAGGSAVMLLLVLMFGSMATDQLPGTAIMTTLVQVVIITFALYMRLQHDSFEVLELSIYVYFIILLHATVQAIAITCMGRAANIRMLNDQVKLGNNERVTSAVFNATTEGIAVAQNDGVLLRVNKQFYDILGIEPQPVGSSIKTQLPGSIRFGLVGETIVENDAGRILNIDQRRSELEGGGEVISFVVRDLTENRQMSIENLHMQKINAIGMLAGGIAHDFNNLLAVIQGNAELVDASSNLQTPQKEYLDTIIASTNRAASLTTQLLSFTHKQESADALAPAGRLVQEAVNIVRPLLGMNLRLEMEQSTNTSVKVNHATFITAFLNLMFNARDAVGSSGTLKVSAVDSGRGTVLFCVEDNGAGIPDDIINKVTAPFFTTKPSEEGSGLGLSMVTRFVESAGGEFSLDSNSGGTTATIELPAVQMGAPEVAFELLENKMPGKRLNILIIDDNVDFASVLLEQIRLLGHTGTAEYSLAGVCKRGDLASYDLIVCDYLLEVGTAITVYDWLREVGFNQTFVLISGNVPLEDLDLISKRDVFTFLQKPISLQQLRNTIEETVAAMIESRPVASSAQLESTI